MRVVDSNPFLVIGGRPFDSARLAEICERFGLVELSVFGSVVRGEDRVIAMLTFCTSPGPMPVSAFRSIGLRTNSERCSADRSTWSPERRSTG